MLAAVAQNLDDEPQDDPAEAEEMSVTSFEMIQRVHELCGHPPARELPAELEQRDCLIAHATKIMRAHLRARELVHEMKQRGYFDLNVSDLVETDSEDVHQCTPSRLDLVDDEADEVVTDWKSVAQDAWQGEGWARAAAEYQFERGKQRGVRP
jgi:hypothetical protein